jgi:hypothetical protein
MARAGPERAKSGALFRRRRVRSDGGVRQLAGFPRSDQRRRLDRSADWRVLTQRQLHAGSPVVFEVGLENAPQTGLFQNDHMIQALAPNGPDRALHVGLPGRSRCRENFPDTHGLCKLSRRRSKLAVSLTPRWEGCLHKNSKRCPHCREAFSQITDEIPIVNRSDGETFHLVLFSVTHARFDSSASGYGQQIICHFEYVHNRFGSDNKFVALTILDASPETPVTRYQIEAAADGIAELVKQGNGLEGAYTFDRGQLISGFPE